MGALEPVLDNRMVHASFSCRTGKGTLAALDCARSLVRRPGWFLKLDVERFLPSLENAVGLGTLTRVVEDRDVLDLAARIVCPGFAGGGARIRHDLVACGCAGRGLPIGALTSQRLANLVLDRLDHHVLEQLGAQGYVRYMDDLVLFAGSKADLRAALFAVDLFLRDRLHLRLKEHATILAPTREGLPFLGWRCYAGTMRLRPEDKRRVLARLRHRAWQQRMGWISDTALADSVRSSPEHLWCGSNLACAAGGVDDPGSASPSTSRIAVEKDAGVRPAEPRQPRRQWEQRGRQRTRVDRNRNDPANANNDLGLRPAKAPLCRIAVEPRLPGNVPEMPRSASRVG